jgi:hypothetical protein
VKNWSRLTREVGGVNAAEHKQRKRSIAVAGAYLSSIPRSCNRFRLAFRARNHQRQLTASLGLSQINHFVPTRLHTPADCICDTHCAQFDATFGKANSLAHVMEGKTLSFQATLAVVRLHKAENSPQRGFGNILRRSFSSWISMPITAES